MMLFIKSVFHTSAGTMAVAGCALQLVSMTAQADSAKVVATAGNAPSAVVLTHTDLRRLVVPYRDLNLSNPEGMRALTARVERAADSVCDQPSGSLSGGKSAEARRCKAAAVADAMAQVDAQLVDAKVAARAEHNCEDATHANAVAQLHVATVEVGSTPR